MDMGEKMTLSGILAGRWHKAHAVLSNQADDNNTGSCLGRDLSLCWNSRHISWFCARAVLTVF